MLGAGAALLWSEAEGAGDVQPGEEKAPVRCPRGLPVPKRGCRKSGEGLFVRRCSVRTRGSFTLMLVRHWHRWSIEAVDAPSL